MDTKYYTVTDVVQSTLLYQIYFSHGACKLRDGRTALSRVLNFGRLEKTVGHEDENGGFFSTLHEVLQKYPVYYQFSY